MASFFSIALVIVTGIIYGILILTQDFSLTEMVWLKRVTKLIAALSGFISLWILIYSFLDAKNTALNLGIYGFEFLKLLSFKFKQRITEVIPFLLIIIFAGICSFLLKLKQGMPSKKTSGHFGSADWADISDLTKLGAYSPENGLFIGTDNNNRSLYLPLCNKLTISPPGGGKTTSSTIPALLSHKGPVFVFDIKGELWATTARYRSETLGRKIVVIDPYDVTRSQDFAKNKPEALLKKYTLNPFDWVPEHQGARDRMINAFASSFIINEGGYSNHFDENAKILIRGYIDFIMSSKLKEERTLSTLFDLMSENVASANNTFSQMLSSSGRAEAAANQISRVGNDEKGSILSTSYRQIDWMSDYNIQATLSHSNFDLRDFLTGNMDIYIVLPEDQIKEHSRLVRMMLSLLMSLIVQANPSELPKQKILFLLDELAQLGYCPDVEQCIEVLRSRGVVVWTVFQSLNQIELFKKPDLFKGFPLKQIFTIDDTKTMQWIQTLGGKKTIVTQTLSSNKGTSKQNNKIISGGTSSSGESESAHETGVDLIPLNEIRELPVDEQFIFLHGAKPIRCKKVRYFECDEFRSKYDENPLER
ncbi:MAG: type IV secretory system conjugative DNA transfer family protein [Gammaproteobacteria bacterium]|nr:type IV secretory system conjugative DNA transfer family protein [Gammaproteobacteria bacterium]